MPRPHFRLLVAALALVPVLAVASEAAAECSRVGVAPATSAAGSPEGHECERHAGEECELAADRCEIRGVSDAVAAFAAAGDPWPRTPVGAAREERAAPDEAPRPADASPPPSRGPCAAPRLFIQHGALLL